MTFDGEGQSLHSLGQGNRSRFTVTGGKCCWSGQWEISCFTVVIGFCV